MRPKGQMFDLKRFREERNLTQKQLSELLKRPQSFLSAIEHGKRSAPDAMLDQLANAYNVDNISDYLSDHPDVDEYAEAGVKDVRDAIVNSPGGLILMTNLEGKLASKDLVNLLKTIKGLSVEEHEHTTPQFTAQETAMAASLIEMLKKEQARTFELDKENKELRAEVERLREQLLIRKK